MQHMTSNSVPTSSYCCRKCRQVLFLESNVSTVSHDGTKHSFEDSVPGKPAVCTSHFLIEPEPYMKEEGKLLCPKCDTRFGTFVWAGTQCSCGFWMVPSIQIPKSKHTEMFCSKLTAKEGTQPIDAKTVHQLRTAHDRMDARLHD